MPRRTRTRKCRRNNGNIPNYEPVNFQQNAYSSRFFTNMGTAKRIREEVGPQFLDGGAYGGAEDLYFSAVDEFFENLLKEYYLENYNVSEEELDELIEKWRDEDEYNDRMETVIIQNGGHDEVGEQFYKFYLGKGYDKKSILDRMSQAKQDGWVVFDEILEREGYIFRTNSNRNRNRNNNNNNSNSTSTSTRNVDGNVNDPTSVVRGSNRNKGNTSEDPKSSRRTRKRR